MWTGANNNRYQRKMRGFTVAVLLLNLLLILDVSHVQFSLAQCIKKCTCIPDNPKGDVPVEVDCSGAGLTAIPDLSAIANIIDLNLRENSIIRVTKADFEPVKNSLVTLDLRRNKISTIENGTFARSFLRHSALIKLAENELASLPDDLFEKAQLTELDLSYNKLTSVPKALGRSQSISTLHLNGNLIRDLQPDSFDGVSGLDSLDLSDCGLRTFDSCAMRFRDHHQSLTILYLDRNNFTHVSRLFFKCMTTSLNSVSMRRCGIRTMGKNLFKELSNLQNIYLEGNNFGELDRFTFAGANLHTLDLCNCSITNIKRNAFAELIIDYALYLAHNDITIIHPRDFQSLRGPQVLDLSYSNIHEIRGKPFINLTNVLEISLGHNQLTDDSLVSGLVGMKRLYWLDVKFNHLTKIPNVNGSAFPNMTTLNLLSNNIRTVKLEHLRNMSHLAQLILKNNTLVEIEDNALSECPRLTNLDLDNSTLTRLPNMTFVPKLIDLHVNNARLESLPDNICTACPNLAIFEANGNLLKTLPSFKHCKSLRVAMFSDNHIVTLRNDTFKDQHSLHHLRLRNNKLTELPEDLFEDTVSLAYLHIDHNQITELSPNLFSNMLYLVTINASYNRVNRLENGVFLNHTLLDALYLNDNEIATIEDDAFPSNGDMKILNLSRNSFPTWTLPLGGFPNIAELYLEDLFDLHQVPSNFETPQVKVVYYTYAYHCCIWQNHDLEFNRTFDPEANNTHLPPTSIPTVDPMVDAIVDQYCINGEIHPDHKKLIEEVAVFWNLTVHFLPGCNIDIIADGNYVGTSDEAALEAIRALGDIDIQVVYKKEVVCYPDPDPLTPCENLMDPWPLRVAIWAIWVLALLGNGTVLFVVIAAREKLETYQFLICNLAFADFCMGIYLAFLAVVDIRTFGDKSFYQSALSWQLGPGCMTAGFIAVFSSELSMYILVVLTLERVHTIANAFNQKEKVKMTVAVIVTIFGWILAAGLALMPLFGINSYSKVAVCLPYVTEQWSDKFYIGLILSLNFVGFLTIVASYIYIFKSICKSPAARKKKQELIVAAFKIAVLIVTALLCWAPIAVIGYFALGDIKLVNSGQAKFFIVFIYPLNACVNPFIYAIFTRQFRQKFHSISRIFQRNKDMTSFHPSNPLRLQRAPSAFNSEYPMSKLQSSHSPEELMRMRQSRRSNSFTVHLVDTHAARNNPSPATIVSPPPGAYMGRRASLPAGFGSSLNVHRHNSNVPNYPPPFRLGNMYGENSSLPNLPEEAEVESVGERSPVLSQHSVQTGSQGSEMQRLSIVPEENEPEAGLRLEEDNISIASSTYEDAQQYHVVEVINEASTDLDAVEQSVTVRESEISVQNDNINLQVESKNLEVSTGCRDGSKVSSDSTCSGYSSTYEDTIVIQPPNVHCYELSLSHESGFTHPSTGSQTDTEDEQYDRISIDTFSSETIKMYDSNSSNGRHHTNNNQHSAHNLNSSDQLTCNSSNSLSVRSETEV